MSQVFGQSNQSLPLPSDWQAPKYQLGQRVRVCPYISLGHDDMEEFGVISGFEYDQINTHPEKRADRGAWIYSVTLDRTSRGWFVYGGVLVAEEDELFPALITTTCPDYEVVLR